MRVDDLVLRSGDRAEVTGTVVRTTSGFGVGYDADIALSASFVWPSDSANVARVRAPADDPEVWSRLLGRHVTATGTWTRGVLHVHLVGRSSGAEPLELPELESVDGEVIHSPWGRDAYAQIEEVWKRAEQDGLLFAITTRTHPDGMDRVTLGLAHMTERIARQVRDLPDGPLTVRVLVRPCVERRRPEEGRDRPFAPR